MFNTGVQIMSFKDDSHCKAEYIFFKNLEATLKFQAPERWHEATYKLRTHTYYVPHRTCAHDLCTLAFQYIKYFKLKILTRHEAHFRPTILTEPHDLGYKKQCIRTNHYFTCVTKQSHNILFFLIVIPCKRTCYWGY